MFVKKCYNVPMQPVDNDAESVALRLVPTPQRHITATDGETAPNNEQSKTRNSDMNISAQYNE